MGQAHGWTAAEAGRLIRVVSCLPRVQLWVVGGASVPGWTVGWPNVAMRPGPPKTKMRAMPVSVAIIEEVLDWRPYDDLTYRNTVPTAMGPVRFVATTEFEATPGATTVHRRFAAPKTPKERAIMEQIASWMGRHCGRAQSVCEQLDKELERRGRDATEEPALPRARPDGPVGSLSSGLVTHPSNLGQRRGRLA
jgi:hypothetical protein